MNVHVIVNPSAGGGRAGRLLGAVEAELVRRGLPFVVSPTRDIEHARELARQAAAAGEIAAAFGGDGLVAAVAGALAGSDGTLAILPGGRGNDLARVLGIPLEPVAACALLEDGAGRELDLGIAGEAGFMGIASCGFDSDANRIANETRLVRGNLVYAYGALRALAGWKPARFTVVADGGEPFEFEGYSFAAANSRAYGGGMFLAPQASLEDGELDLVMIKQVSKLRFLRLLPTVFNGTHIEQAQVVVLRAREVHVSADRPFTVYADGDPVGELPLRFTTRPRCVRTLVPAG